MAIYADYGRQRTVATTMSRRAAANPLQAVLRIDGERAFFDLAIGRPI